MRHFIVATKLNLPGFYHIQWKNSSTVVNILHAAEQVMSVKLNYNNSNNNNDSRPYIICFL